MMTTSGGSKSELAAHNFVALANHTLQHLAVRDVELSTPILNPVHGLQGTRSDCNACSASAKPAGDHFLCKSQVLAAYAIVKHQQPATEAIHYCVPGVTHTTLRDLRNHRSVRSQQALECNLIVEAKSIQQLRFELESSTTDEDPKPLSRYPAAQDRGN